MKPIVQPYANTSRSSRALAQALGCKRILVKKSTYRHPAGRRKVINWGSQRHYPGVPDSDYINRPTAVAKASNKITTLQCLTENGVNTLEFTTEFREAFSLLGNGTWPTIYARHKVSAHSGEGIEIVSDPDLLPAAPLYTKALENWTEWRLHMGLVGEENYQVIRIQQKVHEEGSRRRPGTHPIRNHAAGYVFRVQDLDVPNQDEMEEIGADSLEALGLHFGAIDLAYQNGEWIVIEVNTACGLEGEMSAQLYKEYFDDICN